MGFHGPGGRKRTSTLATPLGRLALLVLVAACGGDGGGDPAGPDGGDEPTPPARFEVVAPATVVEGEAFQITVTARTRTGSVASSFSGSVTLSVSAGALTPGSLSLTGGSATTDVRVTGATGALTLTARTAEAEGSASLEVLVEADQLVGDPASPATEAIPETDYTPDPEDFSLDHPDLAGLPLTRDVLLLSFRLDATVAEANEVLQRMEAEILGGMPGVAGEAPGILVVRTRTTTHQEMDALLDELEGDPAVDAAAPDVALAVDWLPARGSAPDADWIWEADGTGTWGHQAIRLPQAWNVLPVLETEATPIPVGVLDAGFEPHDDVDYAVNLAPQQRNTHGTSSAGIIGAHHDNEIGTDGVNPFASLVVRGMGFSEGAAASLQTRSSWGATMLQGLRDVLQSNLKVVSISLGYSWYTLPIDPGSNLGAQRLAEQQGRLVVNRLMIQAQRPGTQAPLILASAGNDSRLGQDVEARYNSPFAAAGLIHDHPAVVVVEALQPGTGPGDVQRWQGTLTGSNSGGHLSAPGAGIGVPTQGQQYKRADGTSIATPMASGLASYLLSVDPSLDAQELRHLLTTSAEPVAGAAPRIDAFAALLGIDELRGDDRVLRMLLDQDDGTPDGNLRADEDGNEVTGTDADGNGRPGDGRVDMADFRRWRDGYLLLTQPTGLTLDGRPDHPKLDYNSNEVVDPLDELVHPWLDLNGDREVDRTSRAPVGGGIGREVTDLEVLQHLFDDLHYEPADLDGLLESADLHIHPVKLDATGPAEIHSSVTAPGDNTPWQERFHSGLESDGEGLHQIYTVPVTDVGEEWTLRVVALEGAGDTLFDVTTDLPVHPGEDLYWDPDPPSILWQPFRSLDFFVMNVDGSDSQQIPGRGLQPRWSPDGAEIVAWGASCPGQSPTGVLVWQADGSGCRTVIPDTQDGSYTTSVWSPDAEELLVLSYTGGNAGLYFVDVSTGSLTPAYDATAFSIWPDYPDWSPTGSTLVFAAENEDREWAIYKHTVGGGSAPEPFLDAPVSLDDHPRDVANPRYSGDGGRIAYYRITGAGTDTWARWALVVADAVTGEDLAVVPLGEGEPFGSGITAPTWSPDDDRIIFPYQEASGILVLYVVDADGTGLAELRRGSLSADWRPE